MSTTAQWGSRPSLIVGVGLGRLGAGPGPSAAPRRARLGVERPPQHARLDIVHVRDGLPSRTCASASRRTVVEAPQQVRGLRAGRHHVLVVAPAEVARDVGRDRRLAGARAPVQQQRPAGDQRDPNRNEEVRRAAVDAAVPQVGLVGPAPAAGSSVSLSSRSSTSSSVGPIRSSASSPFESGRQGRPSELRVPRQPGVSSTAGRAPRAPAPPRSSASALGRAHEDAARRSCRSGRSSTSARERLGAQDDEYGPPAPALSESMRGRASAPSSRPRPLRGSPVS